MISKFVKPLVVVALAMTLTVITAGNASARPQNVNDGHDVRWEIDTRRMAVYRTWENRSLVVQLYSPTYHLGAHLNGLTITVDSRGSGYADYKLHWDFGNDGDEWKRFTLYRMNGSDYLRAVECRGAGGKGRERIEAIEVWIPRSCLHPNKRLRVKAEVIDWTRYKADGSPRSGIADRTPNNGFAR